MRLPMKTGFTIIALGIALQGCASSPEPAPTAELDPSIAEENEPLMSALVGPSDLESAIIQARTFRRAGDLDGATRTLSQLVLVAPDNPRVLGEYGKTLVAKGQTEDAIAFLNRAIELNPGDWTLFSAQGVAFDQARNFRAANMAYQRALAIQPGEPTVLSNAGLSRMQAGDLANAEILLSRAIEMGGTNPRISRNLAMARDLIASQASARVAAEEPAPPMAATPGARDTTPSEESSAAQSPVAAVSGEENIAVPLPDPVVRREIPAPAPRPSIAAEALSADPTVFMQRIPDPEPVPEAIVAPEMSVASDQETEIQNEAPENEQGATSAPRPLTERVAADAPPAVSLRRLVPVE